MTLLCYDAHNLDLLFYVKMILRIIHFCLGLALGVRMIKMMSKCEN